MGRLVSPGSSSLSATMHKEISCLDLVNGLAFSLGSFGRNKQVSPSELLPKHIPFAIIIEILSWLPVESLVRFKCVCKQWFLLIEGQDDDKFIAKQSVRGSHSMLHYFQTCQEPGEYMKAISDENFCLISSHGGLCLEDRVDSCHIARIRNPATRQVVYLPDAHKDTNRLAFSVDSSTGECKVVCIYTIQIKTDNEDFVNEGVGFQLLTVGKDEQWRPLKHPNQEEKYQGMPVDQPEDMEFGVEVRYCQFAWEADGVVHIAEVIAGQSDRIVELCHLDILSESFTTTILTEGDFPGLKYIHYFFWEERLAFAELTGGTLSVLVLEDFKQSKWSESKIIIPLKFIHQDDPLFKETDIISFSMGDEIIFLTSDWRSLRYDMKREDTQFTEWSEIGEKSLAEVKSTLLNIKGMKPE